MIFKKEKQHQLIKRLLEKRFVSDPSHALFRSRGGFYLPFSSFFLTLSPSLISILPYSLFSLSISYAFYILFKLKIEAIFFSFRQLHSHSDVLFTCSRSHRPSFSPYSDVVSFLLIFSISFKVWIRFFSFMFNTFT